MADRHVDAADIYLAYALSGSGCAAAGSHTPTQTPGARFSVCVTVTERILLMPDFIRTNTATVQFVFERDSYIDR